MATRLLVAALIACRLCPGSALAEGPGRGAPALPPYGISIEVKGLVMTLFVTRPSYPQNALVKATVRLWNSTRAPMKVQEPVVYVLWPGGGMADFESQGSYPSQVVSLSPPFMEPKVGIPAPLIIRPGQAIARHTFVIMRTGRLRATSAVAVGRSEPLLKTGILLVRLGRAPHPAISFGKQNGKVIATIRPTSPRHGGTLWYMSVMRCGSTSSVTPVTGTITWTRVPYADHQPDGSYHLPAPDSCPAPRQWSLAAGWLDQPLGSGNYSS